MIDGLHAPINSHRQQQHPANGTEFHFGPATIQILQNRQDPKDKRRGVCVGGDWAGG